MAHFTPSAQVVAEIDGLLVTILYYLPIKSLLRFKSVSKHWLSLITDPGFSNLRSKNIETATGLFVHRCIFSFVPLNLETSVIATPARNHRFANAISQSCNGLLCCYDLRDSRDFRSKYVYVYNPTTNLHTLILDPTYRVFNSRSVRSVNLAFDPTKSPFYKLVCVYFSDSYILDDDSEYPEYCYEIEIYSSETGLWKHAVDPFTTDIDFKYGVFWNGAINWPYYEGDSLYFNVEEEYIGKLVMPRLPDDDRACRNIVYFGVSNGHLHLIEVNDGPATHFCVYEMERDCSGWFVKYHVNLESVMQAFPVAIDHNYHPTQIYHYRFGIMSVLRGKDDEDAVLVVGIQGKAIQYNISNKTFREVCDFVPGDHNYMEPLTCWRNVFQYIESLSSV